MDAVPSLCAAGTVGVAAVGYALGRPQIPTPSSSKRKSVVRSNTEDITSSSITPRKSPWLSEATSAPVARLQKPGTLRRPQSSIFPRNSTRPTSTEPAGNEIDDGMEWKRSSLLQNEQASADHGPLAFESDGMGTAKSSWLRRLSSFSSYSQNGSHPSSPRPNSSMSFSNGSIVPILSTASNSTPVLPRNKLVKRASSQKLLHSAQSPSTPRSQFPQLRRPATSHQRSATLQQQIQYEESTQLQDPFQSLPDTETINQATTLDDVSEDWRPFFRSRSGFNKEGSTKKRYAAGNPNRYESIKSIDPIPVDAPTLLVAKAIKDMALEEAPYHDVASPNRRSLIAGFSSPGPSPSPTNRDENEGDVSSEQKPRRSFSIGDMLSSSSPSTWKIPRSGSLRRKKGSVNSPHGRRVASAPQPSKTRRFPSPSTADIVASTPSSPLPQLNRLSAFEIDLPGEAPSYPTTPQPDVVPSPKFPQRSPFATSVSSPPGPISTRTKGTAQLSSRVPSDHASTLVGSENESSRRDDMDYQSETAYDSIRTGATGSSHSGIRGGPRIETIFDESPPRELRKNNLAALQDLLSNGSFLDASPRNKIVTEEQGSLLTPRRVVQPPQDDQITPGRDLTHVLSSPDLPSSPPLASLALRKEAEADFEMHDATFDDEWSFNEADHVEPDHRPPFTFEGLDARADDGSMSRQSSISGHKPNLFEWSERHIIETESQQGSSPRPKTTHGQQGVEGRGSRAPGRRGPSALHLRSQSVPVPQDNSTHRGYNSTSKLDSWLLGNKGASEEWDGDFEFEETSRPVEPTISNGQNGLSGEQSGMLVPKSIMERQASVHGQFGQVKELTLLVEELKRLRYQASVQGIIRGQSAELWKEAEGIINLATLDDEEHDFLPPRSPHSPNSDLDPFEEESPASQRRQMSVVSPPLDDLPSRHDLILANPVSSHSSPGGPKLSTPPSSRPRKESAAKAKSVLENISQHRSSLDPPMVSTKTPQKKLPFDTTSLRDLVTRAGVVTRALKEIVRKADDNPQTPERRPDTPPDPPFSQIFQQPSSPPPQRRSPRLPKTTSNTSFSGGSISGNDNDINGHMKMMTVV